MTERRKSVRGSGRDRGGATDTTMLIWKIIDANPGITCDEIWEQVEDRIPMGYALRLYSRSSVAGGSATDDQGKTARRSVLKNVLANLLKHGAIRSEGEVRRAVGGRRGQMLDTRQFYAMRTPRYVGDINSVDVTGMLAGEHMALAEALRTLRAALARCEDTRERGVDLPRYRNEDFEALRIIETALTKRGM